MKRPYYRLAVIVGFAIALLLSAFAYYGAAANARVVAELRNNPQGMRAEIVMPLTFQSGRELPVNYLREATKYLSVLMDAGGVNFVQAMCRSLC